MIQDIAPHKLNNQYGQKKAPDAGSRFLYYDGRKVLVRKRIGGNENQIAYPTYEELKKCMPKDVAEDTEYTYLFAVDDKSYYLGKKENVGILSEQMGYEWIDHQEFRGVSPKYEAFAGITGWQMVSGSQVLWAMWKCDEARSCGTDDAMSEVWTDGISEDLSGCDYWSY